MEEYQEKIGFNFCDIIVKVMFILKYFNQICTNNINMININIKINMTKGIQLLFEYFLYTVLLNNECINNLNTDFISYFIFRLNTEVKTLQEQVQENKDLNQTMKLELSVYEKLEKQGKLKFIVT